MSFSKINAAWVCRVGAPLAHFICLSRLLLAIFLLFTASASAGAAAPLKKITVVLDWFVNPNHAPIILANELGYFKAQGLAVTLITPADPAEPIKWLASGKVDYAVDYQPHVLMSKAKGLPVQQIGTLIPSSLNCLVVLADSGIHTLQQLKGKRIGYSMDAFNSAILTTMLAHVGLALKDVSLINVHYALTQALLTKRVDVVVGMMKNFELPQLALANHPGRAFYPKDYGVPDYAELVFVANSRLMDSQINNRFLAALQQSVQYIKSHPSATWQIVKQAYPELDNTLNKRAMQETIGLFATSVSEVQIDEKRDAFFKHRQ